MVKLGIEVEMSPLSAERLEEDLKLRGMVYLVFRAKDCDLVHVVSVRGYQSRMS